MISIHDEYGIQAEEKQYILVKRAKRVDKETGEAYWGWDKLSYFPTLSDAVTALHRRWHWYHIQHEDMELEAAIQAYREIGELLRDWMGKV